MLYSAQQFEHLLAHGTIERGHGFVANQHFRIQDQGTRDRNALRLTTRQLVWIAAQEFLVEPDPLEHRDDALPTICRRHRRFLYQQRLLDQRPHPHLRIECADRILEYELEIAPMGHCTILYRPVERFPGIDDPTRCERNQPEQRAHETGLARARLAHYGDRLGLLYGKTEIGHGAQIIVLDHGITHAQDRARGHTFRRLAAVYPRRRLE